MNQSNEAANELAHEWAEGEKPFEKFWFPPRPATVVDHKGARVVGSVLHPDGVESGLVKSLNQIPNK